MTSERAVVSQNSSSTNSTDVPLALYPQATCSHHANLQSLKQKKIELEKKLSEKCKLLSQIIRDENNLLKIASANPTSPVPNTNIIKSSMRRKIIGTSFKLPESLLNSPPDGTSANDFVVAKQKDEITQLLLERKIQQQISETAIKLANDGSQSKAIRKTHRQCHDLAQEKLKTIEKNILMLQLPHITTPENSKHIVRHNSIKIAVPMTINQPGRYQPNEKTTNFHLPCSNNTTIPSILMGHKQVYSNIKHKINKSSFFDEYNYSGNQTAEVESPYKDVQFLTGDIISPNYGNVNPVSDDFAQYPTGSAVFNNPKKPLQHHNGGLGGYWYTMENNERIWCTMDNRFSSLDRKTNQIENNVTQKTIIPQQPAKSTSLGNFEFISAPNISKHDESSDSISISSINSENKKQKDKVWSETSLDSPTVSSMYKSVGSYINNSNNERLNADAGYKAISQVCHQHDYNQPSNPTSQIHHRTNDAAKPKLSSHSMSLPNRNYVIGLQNPNHVMPYDDLYLTTIYPDYYQSMHPSSDGNVAKSSTTRLQNNRIMTSSPLQSQSLSADQNIIRYEAPKNVTVVQQAKYRPYKEISKPFEMADFYKYSTKFRQKVNSTVGHDLDPSPNKAENKCRTNLDDLNLQAIQKIYYQPPNPSLCQPINYQ